MNDREGPGLRTVVMRLAEALYRGSLRAFPPRHRDRYSTEMVDAFQRELVDRTTSGGTSAALIFTLSACLDGVRAGVGERRREGGGGNRPRPLEGLLRDATHALRSLARSWIFTGVSLLSLSCGLGIAMAVFLLLRQTIEPPFHVDEEGLAEVFVREGARVVDGWSYPDFTDVTGSVGSARVVGWTTSEGMLDAGEGEAGRQIRTAYVSPGYFDLLGQTPPMGRALTAADAALSGSTPVVITDPVWKSWFASDPEVVGRALTVDGAPHVVVGVAPPYFRGHSAGLNAHLFVPLDRHPSLSPGASTRFDRDARWLRVIARAASGTTVAELDAVIAATMEGLSAAHPETNADRGSLALPYAWQGAEVRNTEGFIIRAAFAGIQGLVLLIVCLNIGGMVLVRSATRERELALRMAIGSSRGRLVQYLMAESVLIGIAGGVLVIAALQAGVAFLVREIGAPPQNVAIDGQVMAVCMGLSLAASVAFGLLPALRFSRASLVSSMRDGSGGGRRAGRIHRFAVAGQVALAVPVLIVAGSVTRGANSMTTAEYGVRSDGLIVSDRLDLAPQGYSPSQVQSLARSVQAEVNALPGVTSTTVTDHTPLDGSRASLVVTSPTNGSTIDARVSRVDEYFFATMDIPILRGRPISADDISGVDPTIVVTTTLADRLFGTDDPIGQRLALHSRGESGEPQLFTVVGVSGDVAGAFLESDTDNVFLSYWQHPGAALTVAVRTSSVDEAFRTAMGDAVVALDPSLVAPSVRPFSEIIEDRGRDMPIWSVFFTIISGLLLGLCALGIYGIVAFAVASRTREIGVRMSLGASRERVVRGVLWDAVRIAAPGLVVGGVLGVAIGLRVLNQMYAQIGLPMAGPSIMLAGAAGALAVVLAASLSPARRAAGVDPMEALRAD